MFSLIFYVSLVASSPLPSNRDRSPSHGETLSHSLVGGVGIGAGGSAGALAVNGIVDYFKGDKESDEKKSEKGGERSATSSNDLGCTPGKVVVISTSNGPQKGVFTADCTIAQIA